MSTHAMPLRPPMMELESFAPSYVSQTTTVAGEVAAQAEERKCSKYSCLPVTHDFVPVAIETTGVMGPQTSLFLKELGWRVRGQTGDPLASSHIFQRLSIAIQRGTGQVASHTRSFPHFQGTVVTPSSLFPSTLFRISFFVDW